MWRQWQKNIVTLMSGLGTLCAVCRGRCWLVSSCWWTERTSTSGIREDRGRFTLLPPLATLGTTHTHSQSGLIAANTHSYFSLAVTVRCVCCWREEPISMLSTREGRTRWPLPWKQPTLTLSHCESWVNTLSAVCCICQSMCVCDVTPV